jgi:hypothetical protein
LVGGEIEIPISGLCMVNPAVMQRTTTDPRENKVFLHNLPNLDYRSALQEKVQNKLDSFATEADGVELDRAYTVVNSFRTGRLNGSNNEPIQPALAHRAVILVRNRAPNTP